jgi:hypothetical protein
MAEIQENIINRSKIKDSINPNDLPDLSFSIPTDPNTTTLCHSTASLLLPSLSVQRLLVAIDKLRTA